VAIGGSSSETASLVTRVHYRVVLITLLVNSISYIDRVFISVAAPQIRHDLNLSSIQLGLVFGAFSLAYFLFQTPWGSLADTYGACKIVAAGIAGWSLFTALCGAAWNLISMLAFRFGFGASEAAVSPAVASAYTRWVPVSERATAFALFLSGGRIGGAITPPIAAFLLMRVGWRWMFPAFGALGILAAAVWWVWYKDDPEKHRGVSAGELEKIRRPIPSGVGASYSDSPMPWYRLLRSGPLLMLLAIAFASPLVWQFYITWFPTYLMEERGFTLKEAAGYATLPLFLGVAGNCIGGLVADALSRKLGLRRGQALVGFCGLAVSALLLYLGSSLAEHRLAVILLSLAAGVSDMTLGATWSTTVAIGAQSPGLAAGLLNSASNMGAMFSPVLMGWAYQNWQNWKMILLACVICDVISAVLWLGIGLKSARS